MKIWEKYNQLSWSPVLRTGGADEVLRDAKACGKGGPGDTNGMEPKCGRPLGLWMSRRKAVDPNFGGANSAKDEDVLLVADSYKGFLMVTGIYGNDAEMHTLATRAITDPPEYKFALLNAIVQTRMGDIYITETSQKFQRRRIFYALMDGASTGRLLRYRPDKGGVVEVVAENLFMPNGITLSHDGKSLLIICGGASIVRFDLESQRMAERPFVEGMPGTGDNIKTMDTLPNGTRKKCYWAALGGKFSKPFSLPKFLSDKPLVRSILLALVPYPKLIKFIPQWTAWAVYDEQGELIEFMKLADAKAENKLIAPWLSEMEPIGDNLYLLSWYNPFLARIKRSDIRY
mmetsp:Transcript_27532/g.46867  ORF Transcript_27532/g.46867 Transcript_27532/m.46867 type:complete len:345 (-) Transcript_27532:853-1887(-)